MPVLFGVTYKGKKELFTRRQRKLISIFISYIYDTMLVEFDVILLSVCEYCEHRCRESHTLLKSVNKIILYYLVYRETV